MTAPFTHTRACWITGPRTAELRAGTTIRPDTDAGEVAVRSRYGGISRGTETLVFNGRVPVGQYDAMRCPHQNGAFPWPTTYGYATVGEVVLGPARLKNRMVFCLHPHQTVFTLPGDAVVPLPPDVPPRRAVLAANMETAVNAIWDAPVLPGMAVAVVGAGTVGGLVATLAAAVPGVRLTLADPDPTRAGLAGRLGATWCAPKTTDAAFGGRRADLVYHASGHPGGFATALGLAGPEATVVELSWYGDRSVPAPLGEDFHARRLRLLSSQVGQVAPAMRPRWRCRDRLAFALSLLANPLYDDFLGDAGRFENLPDILGRLDQPGFAPGRGFAPGMPVIRYD